MSYVIVGAGPAGVVAAETLRKLDPKGEVTLISGEAEPPYSRMAIPYLLTGNIDEAGTYLRKTDGHYDAAGITYRQASVTGVSPDAKTLQLGGGDTLSYDKLLIATGSTPVKPPIEGLDQPGVQHCWTLEDARRIMDLAKPGEPVVLIGAGFIGCIILESLLSREVQLTVVEAEDRMVPRMADETAGGMLKRWCEEKGVTVLTSTRVKSAGPAGGDGIMQIALDNGQSVPARLLVVAAGVKANAGFLEGSGVKIEDGILVDDHLCTSVADIYAAGDCAQGPDFSGDGWSVHAIQPTAVDHGRIAALNMAGHPAAFNGSLAMNVLDTAGLVSSSFGLWQGAEGGDAAVLLDEGGYRYMRINFAGDVVVGALSIGHTENIGILRGLIQTRAPLGPWKEKLQANPMRLAEAYIACCQ